MLDALHPLSVSAGDAVFVPAGTAHAIGAGILMVELQEPTDFSILLERRRSGSPTRPAPRSASAGTGRSRRSTARRPTRPSPPPPCPRPPRRTSARERLTGPATLDQGFSILVVLDGAAGVGDLDVRRGDTILVPHAAGATRLEGSVAVLRCRPPAPDAREGAW